MFSFLIAIAQRISRKVCSEFRHTRRRIRNSNILFVAITLGAQAWSARLASYLLCLDRRAIALLRPTATKANDDPLAHFESFIPHIAPCRFWMRAVRFGRDGDLATKCGDVARQ
jgi:hypothetical protein